MVDMADTTSLVAEVWYATAPDLSGPALLEALRATWPEAESQDGSVTLPHPRPDGDTGPPLLSVLLPGTPPGEGGKTLPEVGQTWNWLGAEAALAHCRASVVVTEMFAADRTPQERLDALTGVVAALVAHTRPVLVSWPLSQRVVNPADVVAGDLDGPVNVRLFDIANDPGALVLDTLGMHVFGLPDLQCHFRDVSPGEVAVLLFATAGYLFSAGDVIADGHTITGLRPEDRVPCHHEPALLAPARTVVDLDLGDPYAAGARDRAERPRGDA
ncbi:MAG: hypothetical protein JWP61_2411 [Friedmanniella sp.]|nr:hypothetical protein [Friedmanniella sp.]